MSASMQQKLTRVRRPRVHITYEVETLGSMKEIELPFVVGVLADLSGQPVEPLKPLKDRKAVFVDRDNFNDVMTKAAPRIIVRVPNRVSNDGTKMNVELNFRSMDDFEPAGVAKQIPPLRELLDVRHKLNQLLARMEGNDKLESLLTDILSNTETARKLAATMGVQPGEGNGNGSSKPEA